MTFLRHTDAPLALIITFWTLVTVLALFAALMLYMMSPWAD